MDLLVRGGFVVGFPQGEHSLTEALVLAWRNLPS
jgi:hypothetical protein